MHFHCRHCKMMSILLLFSKRWTMRRLCARLASSFIRYRTEENIAQGNIVFVFILSTLMEDNDNDDDDHDETFHFRLKNSILWRTTIMLGSILKLTLSFSALFLFIGLLWQSPVADAVPVRSLCSYLLTSLINHMKKVSNQSYFLLRVSVRETFNRLFTNCHSSIRCNVLPNYYNCFILFLFDFIKIFSEIHDELFCSLDNDVIDNELTRARQRQWKSSSSSRKSRSNGKQMTSKINVLYC